MPSLLLVFLFFASLAANQMLLEDARPLISVPRYTHKQKLQVAKAAKNLFKVLVIN